MLKRRPQIRHLIHKWSIRKTPVKGQEASKAGESSAYKWNAGCIIALDIKINQLFELIEDSSQFPSALHYFSKVTSPGKLAS